MIEKPDANDRIKSGVSVSYPDFSQAPPDVQKKYEQLPTKVNFFKMLGHSTGAFIPVIDLTNAIFRDLTISDYHKELLVVLVAANESCRYEWEQHVSIAQAAGVRQEQILAIGEGRLEDNNVFTESERLLLRFGKSVLATGKAPGVLFKHALEYFTVQDLSDALIVLGYYRMISAYIQTFDLAIDAQTDGNWIKG
jgi:alkylhydroperoxidase family enzyme